MTTTHRVLCVLLFALPAAASSAYPGSWCLWPGGTATEAVTAVYPTRRAGIASTSSAMFWPLSSRSCEASQVGISGAGCGVIEASGRAECYEDCMYQLVHQQTEETGEAGEEQKSVAGMKDTSSTKQDGFTKGHDKSGWRELEKRRIIQPDTQDEPNMSTRWRKRPTEGEAITGRAAEKEKEMWPNWY